jgi:hypothetical protein
VVVLVSAVGGVHPVGTVKVTSEPDPKGAEGAVKVKPSWLVVDPAVTEVGDTAIAPVPLAADGEETSSVPVFEIAWPPLCNVVQVFSLYLVAVTVKD